MFRSGIVTSLIAATLIAAPIGARQASADSHAGPQIDIEARFIEDYTRLFGRSVAGMDIEITVWSVNATTPPEAVARVAEEAGHTAAQYHGNRKLFDPAVADFVTANIVLRSAMSQGAMAAGPAIITEDETTIIVPSSRTAVRQPDGCIDLRVKG